MAKDTATLAGPDSNDNYLVVKTKGTLTVRPGELYTERYVKNRLLESRMKARLEVTFVTPKYEDRVEKHSRAFRGNPVE